MFFWPIQMPPPILRVQHARYLMGSMGGHHSVTRSLKRHGHLNIPPFCCQFCTVLAASPYQQALLLPAQSVKLRMRLAQTD